MKKVLKRILTIIIVFVLMSSVAFIIYATTQEKTDIVCSDINLFNALKNALPKNILISTDSSTRTISIPTDILATITSLSLENSNINNLTGLEKFTNLKELNLSNNMINSIEQLSEMNDLTTLDLSKNVSLGSNVNILSNKTNLTTLKISNIGISSVNFMRNLTQLREIDLSENNIGDLQPINAISDIQKLNLSNNRNLTSLDYIRIHSNLTNLNISYTGISSLDGIRVLSKLEELNVRSINTEDISPIVETWENEDTGETYAYLGNIRKLDISYIQNGLAFYDLKNLTKLSELYMLGCNIYSIDGIIDVTSLRYINLEENNIDNLEPLVEWGYENDRAYIEKKSNIKEIVLKNNNISNINTLAYIGDIDYLDLSENHIYNIVPIASKTFSKGFNIKDQYIELGVYDKDAEIDQYIILPNIFQQTRNSSSKVATNDDWSINGMTLNTENGYQQVGNYNVIIDKDKTEEDDLTIQINGGTADGTILKYYISKDSGAIDSLCFKDENLCEAIYSCLKSKKDDFSVLERAKNILNIIQYEIDRVEELDISSHNITYLDGLESFRNLQKLNASGNNFTTIEPLKYCLNIQDLNVSNTAIGNNNRAILEMRMLQKLDLSNTNMNSFNIINEYVDSGEEYDEIYLKDLNISSNGIDDITGIGKITYLENLYIANNRINSIIELKELTNLKILNAANNNIKDIQPLSRINTLRTLNVSNNRISDISPVNSRLTALYFSGNNVNDISSLYKMTSLTDLEMNNNYIEDISRIENLYIKNSFSMQQQKITRPIGSDTTGTISIELPSLFKSAKQNGSKVYTTSEFEVKNCTISGNNVLVNVDEIGDECATVKIIDGKANGSILYIAEPIKTEIKYDINNKTNQNVTATITFSRDVTITNNNGSNRYVFEKNGDFQFEFEDENGYVGHSVAEVDWIDKDKPTLDLQIQESENGVTATITSNEEVQQVEGWNLSDNQKTLTKEYKENKTENVVVKDLVGNETTIKVEITNIEEEGEEEDTTPPELSIRYSTTEQTNQSVTVTISSNEVVQEVEGWTLLDDQKTLTKEYSENANESIVVKDLAGNETTIDVTINNIVEIEEKIGDVNGNDKIDIGDILLIKRHIAYSSSADTARKNPKWKLSDEKISFGDVNKNGRLDTGDILKLQRYIAASNSDEIARKNPNWLNI